MKRFAAIVLAAFAFSSAAQPDLRHPRSPRSEAAVPSTAPAQVNSSALDEEEPPKQVGGTVSAPVLVKQVQAKFTTAARKAKVNGSLLVGMTVETDGIPSHVHVVKSLGYGLDENAVEAITQYRFKPSMQGGKPVRVEVNVDVHFQVFKRPFLF